MDNIVNKKPLSAKNDATFWHIWLWLCDRKITNKERPQVTSEGYFYHLDGLIGINETYDNSDFPLPAVMLEELLHYATTTDEENTSADFSPEFLHSILTLIVNELKDKSSKQKREFQSKLIGALWELIETDAQA